MKAYGGIEVQLHSFLIIIIIIFINCKWVDTRWHWKGVCGERHSPVALWPEKGHLYPRRLGGPYRWFKTKL
jgi:hypothetical protein